MVETFNRYAGEVRYRIIDELSKIFSQHPIYGNDDYNMQENIFRANPLIRPDGRRKVYPSECIVVTNATNGMQRLSPDNFVANYWTFVSKIDHQGNKPGLFLDWVEEDTLNIQKLVEDENVTFTRQGNSVFVDKLPIVDPQTTEISNEIQDVIVFIDGRRSFPSEVNGHTGEIKFDFDISSYSEILVTYNYRNLDPIGIYRIEITEVYSDMDTDDICAEDINSFEFYIDAISDRDELLTSAFDPNITTFQLDCPPLELTLEGGIKGYALRVWADRQFLLTPGKDYLFDPATSTITLIKQPGETSYWWGVGAEIYASYKTEGETRGPFKQQKYYYNNRALNGVILAFGNQIKKGDQAFVEIHNTREISAAAYGSLWNINLDFNIYAKDPMTSLELAKLTHQYLEADLRPVLSFEGIEITEVSMGGEGTEVRFDNTQDPYFTASISLSLNSFWERRYPIYGNFTNILIDAFYMIDPTRSYFYFTKPDQNLILRPLKTGKYTVPKNYPAFTGRLKPKKYNEKGTTPDPGF